MRLLLKLGIRKGTYYIGGADTLPPPLTAEEEAEIIAKLDDDGGYRHVLVERNLRLVVYIAKKFENTGVGIEDLISIGTIGLIKRRIRSAPTRTSSSRPMLRAVLRMKSSCIYERAGISAPSFP